MEIKYLNDGRKVVVIGSLNNQEKIVQEIFITKDGAEIPSGEKFTVRSLHDEPVMSYAEKRAKGIESSIEKYKAEERQAESKYIEAREKLKAIKAVVQSSQMLANLLPETELETFASFITGTIKYLVVDSYTIKPPVEMIDQIISWEGRYGDYSYDSIKLCSILGKSGGELEYRINQYSDGSGGSSQVYPFVRLEDALSHIKKKADSLIDDDKLCEESYNNCIKMGIVFSQARIKKYKSLRHKQTQRVIEEQKQIIAKSTQRIKELEQTIQ